MKEICLKDIERLGKDIYFEVEKNLFVTPFIFLPGEDFLQMASGISYQNIDGKIKEGDIILSHNGTKHTADSLEMLINNIKEKGYTIDEKAGVVRGSGSEVILADSDFIFTYIMSDNYIYTIILNNKQ